MEGLFEGEEHLTEDVSAVRVSVEVSVFCCSVYSYIFVAQLFL